MLNIKQTHNTFIYLLLLFLAGGADMFAMSVFGISMYALRWVIVIGTIFYLYLNFKPFVKPTFNYASAYLGLGAVMIAYGLILTFFSLDKVAAVKELANILFGFCFFFVLIEASKRIQNPGEYVTGAFTWGLVMVLCVSFYEIITKNHLPSHYFGNLSKVDSIHFIWLSPAATFGNPNHLGLYLTLSVFVLSYRIFCNYNRRMAVLLLILSLVALWFTFSRLSYFAVLLPILALPFIYKKNILSFIRNNSNRILGVLFCFFGIVWFVRFGPQIKKEKPIEIVDPNPEGSVSVRQNMIKNGFDMLQKSNYLGVGPGQFPVHIFKKKQPYYVSRYVNAHSGIVEIYAQYGVLVFLLWIVWAVAGIIIAFKQRKKHPAALFISFMGICFIPVSSLNSTFLNSPLSWAYIAFFAWFVYIISMPIESKKAHK